MHRRQHKNSVELFDVFSHIFPFSNEDDDNNDDDGTRDGGDDGRLEQADHRRGGLRARGAQILGGGEAVAPTAARPTREAEKHLEQRILLRGRSPADIFVLGR